MQGNRVLPGKSVAIAALVFAFAACLGLFACGDGSAASTATGTYKDGTYVGESRVYDDGVDGDGYGVVSVTISGGKISDVTFEAFQPDGTLKDDSYGKGTASYSLAQKIVSYVDDYAEALVVAGSPDGVDVISGATYLHDQFVEAAENALEQAQ